MNEYSYHNGKVEINSILAKLRELNPASNGLYSKQDDISLARLFADTFKSCARYNATSRSWYVYDGVRWTQDVDSMIVESYAKILARALLVYSADVSIEGYPQFVAKLGDRRRRVTMITDARDFNAVSQQDFDTNPLLFNCQNCVIDLSTLERIPHAPELLLSKVSNVVYDENASSPDFEKFLREVMLNDEEIIEYLQRIFGYALTGENTREECYMLYGATTRNGKSTLLDTVSYVFGDYAMNIQPETLAQQKDRNSRSASGDIARLDGARLLHMSEPPKRMKFDVALLKTLLGRDVITARHLYEREFQFVPVFKLFINTNYLPLVTDDSLFSSGRVKVIPFTKHFTPEEQDTHLKAKLKTPENVSGIFNWCLNGLRKYQEEREIIELPDTVRLATEDYREKSDKLKSFIKECFIPSSSGSMTAKQAYNVFSVWCRENGYGVENKSNFIDELRNKGLLHASGTVNGVTSHNVIVGYLLDMSILPDTTNPFDE